jgi:hypothetical protein
MLEGLVYGRNKGQTLAATFVACTLFSFSQLRETTGKEDIIRLQGTANDLYFSDFSTKAVLKCFWRF